MAYDEALADRIRSLLTGEDDVAEKKMFGGLAFLIGNMAVSASGQGGLLLRCEPSETAELVQQRHASTAVMRGRAMEGWLRVDVAGVQTDEELQRWVSCGVGYARSLPPKA